MSQRTGLSAAHSKVKSSRSVVSCLDLPQNNTWEYLVLSGHLSDVFVKGLIISNDGGLQGRVGLVVCDIQI